MARVFISHSSKDNHFARRLADDLSTLGHTVWIDEREIKVGDVIPSKIEKGLASADFVVVVLSKSAVESGWVDQEVKAKQWQEITQARVMVLPALIEDCDIPLFLQVKKYADFRKNYSVGLAQLASAILPSAIPMQEQKALPASTPVAGKVAELLGKIEGRAQPLARSITEAVAIAQEGNNADLERFCRDELRGWTQEEADTGDAPAYRMIEAFLSIKQVNMNFVGWGGSAANVFAHMRLNPNDYKPYQMMVPFPVGHVEKEASQAMEPDKGLISYTFKAKDVMDVPERLANFPVFAYFSAASYGEVLERIRGELVRRLLDLLPTLDAKKR